MSAAFALWAALTMSSSVSLGLPNIRASATSEAPSRDGTLTLSWSTTVKADNIEFDVELRQPNTPQFESWYRGSAQQSFLSGLPDGIAYARVRIRQANGPWSAWSAPIDIPIQHHSMDRALGLMGLGFIVFSLLASYIVVMASKERHK